MHAAPVNAVQEYTLENGMQIFLLEDSSDAQVHIEYTCRAGFSSQTQSTCGFFKLYTRLVKAATPEIVFTDVQCNADSSRYFVDISPAKLEATLFDLSDAVFGVDFSDEVLKTLLSAVANAEHNKNLPVDTLFIKEIWCGKALTMKRIMPGPRGSARPILKPFSNLTIVLESGAAPEKKKTKKVTK